MKFTEIDDSIRVKYGCLEPQDRCFFFGEHIKDGGYTDGANQLIENFKKPLDTKGGPQWYYKERDIKAVADLFQKSIPEKYLAATLVPIPPSKAHGDPDYDDRMLRTLNAMQDADTRDIRELILQHESTEEYHKTKTQRSSDKIMSNYIINKDVMKPAPKKIVLFDDVITTGAHFKAAQRVIQKQYPEVPVAGIFIARHVGHPDGRHKHLF